MPRETLDAKAERLVREGRVTRTPDGWVVRGDHDSYTVQEVIVRGKPTLACSCPTHLKICSHIRAVRITGGKKMEFDARSHLIRLRGSEYLEVKWRIAWFRNDYPADSGWGIVTCAEEIDDSKARYRATIIDPQGRVISTATKTETKDSFPDYAEKAETGAIGRALALVGYGTQFTGDELSEGRRIVDSPVQRQNSKQEADEFEDEDVFDQPPAVEPQRLGDDDRGIAEAEEMIASGSLSEEYKEAISTVGSFRGYLQSVCGVKPLAQGALMRSIGKGSKPEDFASLTRAERLYLIWKAEGVGEALSQ